MIANLYLSYRAAIGIVAAVGILAGPPAAASSGELSVEVVGLTSPTGAVMVSLYDSEQAFSEKLAPFRSGKLAVEGPAAEWTVADLPPGDYAIRVYHDINGNGEMDRNAIGIPREPVGFSNNPQSRFGPPGYQDARFAVRDRPEAVVIRLRSVLGGANGGIGLGLGIGMMYGSSVYRGEGGSAMAIPFVTYFGDRFYVLGTRLGVTLGSWGKTTVRAVTGFRFGGYDAGDSDFLTGMDGRGHTLEAGVSLTTDMPFGLGLGVEALTDALGRYSGQEAGVSIDRSIRAGGWSFTPTVGAIWQSARLVRYYYGVSRSEATAFRPDYQPSAALNWTAGARIGYSLTDQVMVTGMVSVRWLDDEIRHSPIVDGRSRVSTILGISYML